MRIKQTQLISLLLIIALLLGLSECNNLKKRQSVLSSSSKHAKKTVQRIALQKNELKPETALKKLNLLIQYQASLLQLNKVSLLQISSEKKFKSYESDTAVFLQTENRLKMQHQQSIELRNIDNSYFTGDMSIGGLKFAMIFDTGSSLVFVNSDYCGPCIKNKDVYYTQTKTLKESKYEVNVEFGSGKMHGIVSQDDIKLGDVQVKEGIFVQITDEEGDIFENSSFDGIVGIMRNSLSEQIPSFIQQISNSGAVEDNVFGFFLTRDQEGSQLTLGGVDDSKLLNQEISYHNAIEDLNFWALPCKQLRIGNQDSGLCSEDNICKLVIDSGTSLFTGPSTSVTTLLQTLNTQTGGCKSLYDLPTLTFVVEDQEYIVYPTEYVMTVTEKGPDPFLHHADIDDIIECVVAFYGLEISENESQKNMWILGDAFMGKFYTVFDKANNKIGLGKSINYHEYIHP